MAGDPDGKVHEAYMGPPGGPHVGPMNLVIKGNVIIVRYAFRVVLVINSAL